MRSLSQDNGQAFSSKQLSLGLLILLLSSCSQTSSKTSGDYSKSDSKNSTTSTKQEGKDGGETKTPAPGSDATPGGTDTTTDSNGEANSGASIPVAKYTLLFVGGGSAKIDTYKFDKTSGATSLLKSTSTPGANPTFLAINPSKNILIAGNESGNAIMSFKIDAASGALTLLNTQPMAGGPAHVAIDAAGKWAFAASYGNGHVASYPLGADGKLGAASQDLAAGLNAHEIAFSPSGTQIWVPCLGSNYIAQYAFSDAGQWTPLKPATVAVGSVGPRHLATHPNGKWVYLMNELASSVQPLTYDGSTLQLNGSAVSSLLNFSGTNSGAEIAVHPNGKFLYSSNRGEDSIAIFSIADTGGITLIKTVKTGGSSPRHFALDASGSWMTIANQNQGGVTLFTVDATTGDLKAKGAAIGFDSAQFAALVDFAQ